MFVSLQKSKNTVSLVLLAFSALFYSSCTCNKNKVTESVFISFDTNKEAAVDRALAEFTFKNYSEKKGGATWHAYDSVVLASFGSNDFNDTLLSLPIKGLYTLNNKKILIKLFATAPTDYLCDECQPLISMGVYSEKAPDEYTKLNHHFLSNSGSKGLMGKFEARVSGDTMIDIELPSIQGVNKWNYHYKNGLKHTLSSN